jgi:hypothetical protein
VVSSRGYFIVRSARAAGNRDVKAFESWLLEEAKPDAAARP